MPIESAEKLSSFSKDFRYGKILKKAKTIEAMTWQYALIKNTDNVIKYTDGKFEVIENGKK